MVVDGGGGRKEDVVNPWSNRAFAGLLHPEIGDKREPPEQNFRDTPLLYNTTQDNTTKCNTNSSMSNTILDYGRRCRNDSALSKQFQ
ncbi:hypothetical protein M0804_012864 [Polistes exclamans]|nr:hypothetical protein M0804_012864 [Polistes exclamans]